MARKSIRATPTSVVQNPYDVLRVARDADESTIKTAFRRLAAEHHPDKNPGDPTAQQRFSNLNAAYQILSDPQKRAAYDRFGDAAFRPGGFGHASSGQNPFDFSQINLGDFVSLDNFFGDVLGKMGVRFGKTGDIKTRVSLKFEEAALGCERTIEYGLDELCPRCSGSGGEPGATTSRCGNCDGHGRLRAYPLPFERSCPECRGSGRRSTRDCTTCRGAGVLSVRRKRTVEIPAGIESGAIRHLRGEGSRPSADRPAGDLLVEIAVEDHDFFRRQDDDLRCQMTVSFAEAALGGEIEVPTLTGSARLKIPAGTQPGTQLKMRGKGLARQHRAGHGDQLVEIVVAVPKQLSPRAKALVEALAVELSQSSANQGDSLFSRLRKWF